MCLPLFFPSPPAQLCTIPATLPATKIHLYMYDAICVF